MAENKDVMGIHPLERMDKLDQIKMEKKKSLAEKKKELEELEIRKRQEIEELENKKRKELEDLDITKKELEKLKEKKAKEISETDDLIEQSFQDLMRHKKMLISQEEDLNKQAANQNLEDITANAPNIIPKNVDYGRFFEKLEVPERLYDITNRGFYDNLNTLRERALTGELTAQEENFVEQLRDRFENFNQPAYLNNRDDRNYVQRSMKLLEEIDVSLAYK